MDPLETVVSRCVEAGLDATVASDPAATIHRSVLPSAPALETLPGPSVRRSSRNLPRISVDLHGTLSGSDHEGSAPAAHDRDLEVISTLGEGGMGRVFLARQHSLDREVAVKTVRHRAADNERAALLSEGAIAGSLEHPSIVPVHALGVDEDGRPVLVMKRVEGVAWSVLLAEPGHPAWHGRRGAAHDRLEGHLEILIQVCNAAHFAHSRGVVHRDIKPQNVLLGRYGEVVLADWGVAFHTDRGAPRQQICGTPAYMAPEMAAGGPVDARTDVYLLGATLHEILAGAPRHRGTSLRDVLVNAILSAPIDYPPSVPAELGALANRATSADPEERPASAAELRQALTDFLQHRSSIALSHSAVERLKKLRALDDGRLGDEDTQRDVDLVVVEARFALQQALDQWGENPVALKAMADLAALLDVRRARAADLERLAREHDPRVSGRQRALAGAMLAMAGVTLSVAAIATRGQEVTPRGLLYQSLAPLGIVVVALALLRRHLLRTVINRRAVVGVLAIVGGITASRALGVLGGVSAAHMLLHDSLLAAAVGAACAALLFRWLAFLAVIMLAAAVGAASSPERAMFCFSLGSGLSLIVGVYFAWKTDGVAG